MIYGLIIAGIFIGELFLKNDIEKKYREGEAVKKLKGRLVLEKHHNRGFALNKAGNRQPLVAACSLGLACFCTLLFLCSLTTRGNGLLRTGLAFLLGGAYSNTYDRLKRKYVVDYVRVRVPWKKQRHIIFNISDFCILIGALLSVLGSDLSS